MWKYTDIMREEFEARKDFVETVLKKSGAIPLKADLLRTESDRTVFEYAGNFYRVDEILFPDKPFIVIEWSDRIENVRNNVMEDTNSYPYDLSDDEIRAEIRCLIEQ